MKLHLIRHGTTTTSGHSFAGRADVPLNAEGRQMAVNISQQMRRQPIAMIISSPLSRAVDTATPLAKTLNLQIETDPLLLEFDFGDLEGQPKTALEIPLRKRHATQPVPGGEALIDVWHRTGQFLSKLGAPLSGKSGHVVVMGHFWTNRMIYGHLTDLDFERTCRLRNYRPNTGSIETISLSKAKTVD